MRVDSAAEKNISKLGCDQKSWIQPVHICTLSVLIHTTSGTKINNKPLLFIQGALSIRFFSTDKTQAVIIRLMKGAF